MSISKRKLKSGKTVYDVSVYVNSTEGKRRREKRTFYSLAEARAHEAAMITRYGSCDGSRGSLELKRYIYTHYWPIALKRLSATSIDTYEKEIRLRIVPALGEMKLHDIDRAAIQTRMVDNCSTDGVARKAIGVLKTILNEAMSDGYITHNHACDTFALPEKQSEQRDNGLVLSTFAEIYELLDIVDKRASTSVKRIAYTGLLQGLRPEERYALDWSCIDLESKTLTITEARVYSKHKGVTDKETKTENGTRTIPLHPRFFGYLSTTPSNRKGAFITGAKGGRISPSTARHRWDIFLRDNPQCPPVTVENMRHSFATAYLSAGGRIEVLSRMLGHANISVTINRYYRPSTVPLASDMERVAHRAHELPPLSAGIRCGPEFDSPRLHQLEQTLKQVIAEFLENGEQFENGNTPML